MTSACACPVSACCAAARSGPAGRLFVIVALGSIVFDGLSQTQRWFSLMGDIAEEFPSLNPSSSRVLATLGLLA